MCIFSDNFYIRMGADKNKLNELQDAVNKAKNKRRQDMKKMGHHMADIVEHGRKNPNLSENDMSWQIMRDQTGVLQGLCISSNTEYKQALKAKQDYLQGIIKAKLLECVALFQVKKR